MTDNISSSSDLSGVVCGACLWDPTDTDYSYVVELPLFRMQCPLGNHGVTFRSLEDSGSTVHFSFRQDLVWELLVRLSPSSAIYNQVPCSACGAGGVPCLAEARGFQVEAKDEATPIDIFQPWNLQAKVCSFAAL